MSIISPSIAVVGSGPSGCYLAQALRKTWPDSEVSVFESEPVPFGLLRYGIAADHQGSKSVAMQFDRLFRRDGVKFFGNVTIGRDLPFERLTQSFDVVAIATGLARDLALPVPQDPRANVVGAGEILRALNGYPEPRLPNDGGRFHSLGESLAIVGHGNVAVDVARLLAKRIEQFDNSDIDDDRVSMLRSGQLQRIHLIGRSNAAEAKFDLSMLSELCALDHVKVSASGLSDDDQSEKAVIVRNAARRTVTAEPPVEIAFHFECAPVQVDALGTKSVLRGCSKADGIVSFHVDTVVTAIGFTDEVGDIGVRCGAWSAPNVFRVGWVKNGGKGGVAANRKDAQTVAAQIVTAVRDGALQVGRRGLVALGEQLPVDYVRYAGWLEVDRYERNAAGPNRLRKKITDRELLLKVARGDLNLEVSR
ncbi:FAD-dependent oxidoreductase [Burkholderia sp. BCC1998]|uniref:FAD-dependent oxidoreductase n=1 Tax=Burkholderia sp. BCC1998 TaxID=2817447 RepID=UPI002AB645FA|nr:FAD-dependent oxidoreductase [Burkholderia sp. BCC1998]